MVEAGAGHALFAYGSLQVEAVMEAVTGRRFAPRPAHLPGYRRRLLRGRTYPGVVADPRETTHGVLFEGLGAEDLEILDLFEGDPYERLLAPIAVGGAGAPRHGFVYVVRDEWAGLLTEEPWEIETFRDRALEAFLAQCRAFRRDVLRGARWTGPA
jgi:gamma-glutamylcyclotransferase (GGCT)/AIG2-like uncharacterized protein YtfP